MFALREATLAATSPVRYTVDMCINTACSRAGWMLVTHAAYCCKPHMTAGTFAQHGLLTHLPDRSLPETTIHTRCFRDRLARGFVSAGFKQQEGISGFIYHYCWRLADCTRRCLAGIASYCQLSTLHGRAAHSGSIHTASRRGQINWLMSSLCMTQTALHQLQDYSQMSGPHLGHSSSSCGKVAHRAVLPCQQGLFLFVEQPTGGSFHSKHTNSWNSPPVTAIAPEYI